MDARDWLANQQLNREACAMGGSPSIAPLYPNPPCEYRRPRMVTVR
jgi:hypothetical protein